jgi:hypothetical protein
MNFSYFILPLLKYINKEIGKLILTLVSISEWVDGMQQNELKTFNHQLNKLDNELIEQTCYCFYYSDKIK